MTTTEKVKQRKYLLVQPATRLDALEAIAKSYRRPLNAELALALALHLCAHALHQLSTPEGVAEAKAMGLDPDAEREKIKGQITALHQEAFNPAPTLTAAAAALVGTRGTAERIAEQK